MKTDLPDIVLLGWSGAGKSTAANLLYSDLGYAPLGFAGRAESPHHGSPRDIVTRIWGPEAVNDREKLIAVANACRSVDSDVWLRPIENLLNVRPRSVPVVVDDCRFENEFWGLKGRGFVSVRITAPLVLRRDRLLHNGKYTSEEYFDHPIEHYLDDVKADHAIVNDGSKIDLFNDLVAVIDKERRAR